MSQLKAYTYEEAYEATLKYFGGDALAAQVWVNKYALKDSDGNIYELTPDDMHRRLANEIARIEAKYPNGMDADEVFGLLRDFRYVVPQGSPMAGIGNDFQVGSLSNCFVIGIDGKPDSYGGIMRIDEEQVQLMKRRGGVGHDLSHIRPKGMPVKNSALTSTGLVPFMERYSNSTREVAQDGRRGALMMTVSIKHPDSEAFIDAKMTPGKVTGANVSVRIDDAFMEAVEWGKPYVQQFPVDSDEPEMKKEIDAAALWKKIVTQCMEIGRARRALLGHHPPRVGARLLCRPRLRDRLDQPLRRDSPLPLRQLPPSGHQPLLLCKESLHTPGRVRL